MRLTRYALLILALFATGASAQRRVRGDPVDFDKMARESKVAMKLSNGDVEDMDPVKYLIDKRKDLKLTDDQQKQLKDIQAKTKETNKPLFKQLDSLRQAMRPRAGFDEDADRARMGLAREAVGQTVLGIRQNYAASLVEAKPLLTTEQAPKAEEFLQKQNEEAEETLRREAPGAVMGGPAGGGRRGGRPPM
jgi:Spy/CpxP family protein refolding chaperone